MCDAMVLRSESRTKLKQVAGEGGKRNEGVDDLKFEYTTYDNIDSPKECRLDTVCNRMQLNDMTGHSIDNEYYMIRKLMSHGFVLARRKKKQDPFCDFEKDIRQDERKRKKMTA